MRRSPGPAAGSGCSIRRSPRTADRGRRSRASARGCIGGRHAHRVRRLVAGHTRAAVLAERREERVARRVHRAAVEAAGRAGRRHWRTSSRPPAGASRRPRSSRQRGSRTIAPTRQRVATRPRTPRPRQSTITIAARGPRRAFIVCVPTGRGFYPGPRGRVGAAHRRRLDAVVLVAVTRSVLAHAGALQPFELTTLDAIHLATALGLDLPGLEFLTFDRRLGDAARASGLEVRQPGW